MDKKLKFENIVNTVAEAWGWYLHGSQWEKKELSEPKDLTEEEHKKAMETLATAYSDLIDLCTELEYETSAFKSMVYRTAVCMSEELHAYGNAYNLADVAQFTPHRGKFFRDAVRRNKGRKNIAPKQKIEIDLERMVREVRL